MGIKQMGLTLGGGVISALVLPLVAARWGWRAGVLACAVGMAVPVVLAWRPLGALARPDVAGPPRPSPTLDWAWTRRPALLVVFGGGVVLGMVQSAVLAYLPIFSVQALGFSPVGAGVLDRRLAGRRRALAAGPGRRERSAVVGSPPAVARAHLRPGRRDLPRLRMGADVASRVGDPPRLPRRHRRLRLGRHLLHHQRRGRRRHAVRAAERGRFGAIVVGLLVGAPLFGALLVLRDSYGAAWTVFAALAAGIALVMAFGGEAIHRECARAGER